MNKLIKVLYSKVFGIFCFQFLLLFTWNLNAAIDVMQYFLTSSNKLSSQFYDRVKLLENLFHDCNGALDLNYALIARMTSELENEEVIRYMNFVITQAKKDSQPVSLQHIYTVLHDHDYGQIKKIVEEDENFLHLCKRMTAVHEAGHAVIGACYNRSKVISIASIQSREKCSGFVDKHSIYEDTKRLGSDTLIKDAQKNIMAALAGAIAEQVFGFSYNSDYQKEYCHQKWGNKTEENLAIVTRYNPCLTELYMNPGADQDMQSAVNDANHIMILELGEDILKLNKDEKFEKQVQILSKLHNKTEKLIKERKDEITKVANLLLHHDIVPGKLIYEICNTTRPEYDFEKVDSKFKLQL